MSVGKLTGPKKAAILLLALGEDAAADVMKNLEESEIQQVGYYMSRFSDVAAEELDLVLEERKLLFGLVIYIKCTHVMQKEIHGK